MAPPEMKAYACDGYVPNGFARARCHRWPGGKGKVEPDQQPLMRCPTIRPLLSDVAFMMGGHMQSPSVMGQTVC
jgi:hypothetical protein